MDSEIKSKAKNILENKLNQVSRCVSQNMKDYGIVINEDSPPIIPYSEKTENSLLEYNNSVDIIKSLFGENVIDFTKYEERLTKILAGLDLDDD